MEKPPKHEAPVDPIYTPEQAEIRLAVDSLDKYLKWRKPEERENGDKG